MGCDNDELGAEAVDEGGDSDPDAPLPHRALPGFKAVWNTGSGVLPKASAAQSPRTKTVQVSSVRWDA